MSDSTPVTVFMLRHYLEGGFKQCFTVWTHRFDTVQHLQEVPGLPFVTSMASPLGAAGGTAWEPDGAALQDPSILFVFLAPSAVSVFRGKTYFARDPCIGKDYCTL